MGNKMTHQSRAELACRTTPKTLAPERQRDDHGIHKPGF